MPTPLLAPLLTYAGRLRFPTLFMITAALVPARPAAPRLHPLRRRDPARPGTPASCQLAQARRTAVAAAIGPASDSATVRQPQPPGRPEFDADREAVIARALEAGVEEQLVPAMDHDSWPACARVCAATPGLHAAYGLHPVLAVAAPAGTPRRRSATGSNGSGRARSARCGLDFFIEGLDPEQQRLYFQRPAGAGPRLRPAGGRARAPRRGGSRPSRLRRIGGLRGVVHSFAGSEEQARQLFDLGFMLGIGGPVTYERARRLHRLRRRHAAGIPAAGDRFARPARCRRTAASATSRRASGRAGNRGPTARGECRVHRRARPRANARRLFRARLARRSAAAARSACSSNSIALPTAAKAKVPVTCVAAPSPAPQSSLSAASGPERRPGAADAAVGLRIAHVLQRIDRRHAEVAFLALREVESARSFLRTSASSASCSVRDRSRTRTWVGIGAPAGRADHDQRQLAPAAPGDQFDLAAETVAGIEHQVVARPEQLARGWPGVRNLRDHVAPSSPGLMARQRSASTSALPRPNWPVQRMQLAIAVGHADFVRIDQRQRGRRRCAPAPPPPRNPTPPRPTTHTWLPRKALDAARVRTAGRCRQNAGSGFSSMRRLYDPRRMAYPVQAGIQPSCPTFRVLRRGAPA